MPSKSKSKRGKKTFDRSKDNTNRNVFTSSTAVLITHLLVACWACSLIDYNGLKIVLPIYGSYFATSHQVFFYRVLSAIATLAVGLVCFSKENCFTDIIKTLLSPGHAFAFFSIFRIFLYSCLFTLTQELTDFFSLSSDETPNIGSYVLCFFFIVILMTSLLTSIFDDVCLLKKTTGSLKIAFFSFSGVGLLVGILHQSYDTFSWEPFGMKELLRSIAFLFLPFELVKGVCFPSQSSIFQSFRLLSFVFVLAILFFGPSNNLVESSFKVIESRQSNTGLVSVMETEMYDTKLRLLKVDHSHVGGQYTTGESAFSIFNFHEALFLAHPEPKSFLSIGLGVGVIVGLMQQRKLHVDVVEIDPVIVDFASRHFYFFDPAYKHGKTYTSDFLKWLPQKQMELAKDNTSQKYDLIIHDIFTGGCVPSDLFSIELFIEIKKILSTSGVLGINYFGYLRGPKSKDFSLLTNTLKQVFTSIRCFSDEHGSEDIATNYICFVSDDSTGIQFRKIENDYRMQDIQRSIASNEIEIPNLTITEAKNLKADFVNRVGQNFLWELQRHSAISHYQTMNTIFTPQEYWIPFS